VFFRGLCLRISVVLGPCPMVSLMAAPIHDAAMDGDMAVVEQLLDQGQTSMPEANSATQRCILPLRRATSRSWNC
jgi:hypothetical protein